MTSDTGHVDLEPNPQPPVQVVPILHPEEDSEFKMDVFYTDIVKLAADDWSSHQAYSVEDLTEIVIKKTFVKRTTSRLKFDLGGGVEVGVATYNLLGRACKPTRKRLACDTNEEVTSERAYFHPGIYIFCVNHIFDPLYRSIYLKIIVEVL